MRIGFCFGPISTGERPFDFTRIEQDPRGLTGTDGSFLYYAKFMRARGHDVTLFCEKTPAPTHWGTPYGKIPVYPYAERKMIDDTWDACLSWNDLISLEPVNPKVVRIVDMQANDYTYVRGHEFAWVDAFVAASTALGDRLRTGMCDGPKPPAHIPFYTVYNGCDPTIYDCAPKVPGRCIYTSSPDRGLHIVLDQWSNIKKAVPHAELRIFYHSMKHWFDSIPDLTRSTNPNCNVHAQRAMFVRDRLNQPGVVHVGSLSREQMALEYSEAQVLAYPCDPIIWTEGYGVSVIEGCASGAVPVISEADAFPEVYGGACPMVKHPAGHHGHEWSNLVIEMLTNETERQKWVALGKERAKKYDYRVLCVELERVINEVKAKKAS